MENEEKISEENRYFKANKPSIIDLYVNEKKLSLAKLEENLKLSSLQDDIKTSYVNDDLLRVDYQYKEVKFSIYLKIMKNDDIDLFNISQVLTDNDKIEKANNCEYYIKSYVDAKHDFVKAYYAQIKLLASLSDVPLIIVDCSQWCIYSDKYIKQFSKSNVDIVDSNLFKIKATPEGSLYTDGLDRFGIKEIEMIGINKKYIKGCASFLSRLSRYFIENGQIPNSCKSYAEVFESPYYACIIDMKEAMDDLIDYGILTKEQREESILADRMYVSIHADDEITKWYENSEEVLEYLLNKTTYYSSQDHFDNEKILAQETIGYAIDFLSKIDDESNLMILARSEDITTDWYYFSSRNESTFVLKTTDSTLEVDFNDIINWNYRGITPLHAYSLEQ